MQVSDVQRDSIIAATRRLNIWHGPVRSGKTVASIIWWLNYLRADAPPGELYMLGKTFAAINRNVLLPLAEMVGRDYHWYAGRHIARLWGRTIHVLGMNDERSVRLIQGSTSAGTYGDEIATWPETAFKMSLTRLSLPGARFGGTTNPDNPRHWLRQEYLERKAELDLAEFTWPLEANPFLPRAYIEAVKREFVGLFYRRYILGQWVAAEGAIYSMFDESVHLQSQFPRPDAYIVGVDYGTSVPMVYLMIGIQYRHNAQPMVWVEREHYYDPEATMRTQTDAKHARDLMAFMAARDHREIRISAIYCDPSAASFRAECAQCGIPSLRDIDTADNSVVSGVSTVSTMMAQGRLHVHPRCERLLQEIAGYVWDAKAQQRGKDAPRKQADHAVDALRYALHTQFGISSEGASWAAGVRRA